MYKARLVVLTACVAAAVGYRVDTNVGIYGGEVVDSIEQAPYMAYLHCRDWMCGGSVIRPQFILTAAHCVEKVSHYDCYVKLNTTLPHQYNNKKHAVKNIIMHHNYDKKTKDYDIALIQLKEAVTTPTVEVADEDTALTDGDKLDIYGWGKTENIHFPNRLRHISLPFFDFDKCVTLMSTLDITITPRMFCAGGFVDDRDSCSGDSGGPVIKGSKQVGLVSFGAKGACGVMPGVYTKLSDFTNWINDNIEE